VRTGKPTEKVSNDANKTHTMKKERIEDIIKNLKTIAGSDLDLEALEIQTNSIVSDLKDIENFEQGDIDLDELQAQTWGIVSDLKVIGDSEEDLDAYGDQNRLHRLQPQGHRGGGPGRHRGSSGPYCGQAGHGPDAPGWLEGHGDLRLDLKDRCCSAQWPFKMQLRVYS
jgi:hypothetical protein